MVMRRKYNRKMRYQKSERGVKYLPYKSKNHIDLSCLSNYDKALKQLCVKTLSNELRVLLCNSSKFYWMLGRDVSKQEGRSLVT